MRNALVLALSALVLFLAGSTWLALFPFVPKDLGGAPDLDRAARHVRVPVGEDDSLDAWVLRGPRPGTIVLLHGYARDHHHEWRYAQALRRDGWTLVAPDFRSSRATRRKPTTLGWWELQDTRAVLAWVRRQPGLAGRPVGLFGESLGGSVAIVAAADDGGVAAVALDSPFADGRRALDDAFPLEAHVPAWLGTPLARAVGAALTGHDPAALDALAALRAWRPRPLWLVQSGREDRFSRAQGAMVAEAAGPAAETWLVEGAGHNHAWQVSRAEYERRLRDFFRRALGAPAVPPGGGHP